MINVNTLARSYVQFSNVNELTNILNVFKRFGFNYKNGTHEDAIDTAEGTAVNKVTCKDGFVFTSKTKMNTVSYQTFMNMADSLTNNTTLINKNIPMRNEAGNPRAIINELKADRLFKDENYVEALVKKSEGLIELADNFVATLEKAEDKANKICELTQAYSAAISARDISEIERLEKLIDSAVVFVTKTNKVLSEINTVGKAIIKAQDKADPVDGAKFIGE